MSKQSFDSLLNKYLAGKCSPEEKTLVEQWYDLVGNEAKIPKSEIEWYSLRGKMWQAIQEQTQENETIVIPFWQTQLFRIGIAACFGLVFLSYLFFTQTPDNQLITTYLKETISQENSSTNIIDIKLEDGSLVQLSPKSKITYPTHFSNNKREVSLIGDAFFDIQRNPEKPFFITTGNTITKVLGTSFFIKSSKNSKVEVEVKTGRVLVYEKNAKDKKDNGVILTPNLKATYFDENELFVTGLVEKPIIQEKIVVQEHIQFVFDETPLSVVLTKLEQAYGIEIITDNEKLNNALLTANITEQDLYTKLDIICAAVNAHYEVKGTTILISK